VGPKKEALRLAQERIKMLENFAAEMKKRAESKTAYTDDAVRLVASPTSVCLTCHNVGKTEIQGPKGPNLALTAERLRPEWVDKWLATPTRLFTSARLSAQTSARKRDREGSPAPVQYEWQALFIGPPLEQVRAARDILMDPQRLANLPALKMIPPPAPAGGMK